jgi:hypothetical protein
LEYILYKKFTLDSFNFAMSFYVGSMQRICLFHDDFYSDSTLILTTAVKQCMDIGARSHVCGVFLMILIFALTLEYGLYTPSSVGAAVWRKGLALSIGLN